jgi:hypothetical protein
MVWGGGGRENFLNIVRYMKSIRKVEGKEVKVHRDGVMEELGRENCFRLKKRERGSGR